MVNIMRYCTRRSFDKRGHIIYKVNLLNKTRTALGYQILIVE